MCRLNINVLYFKLEILSMHIVFTDGTSFLILVIENIFSGTKYLKSFYQDIFQKL